MVYIRHSRPVPIDERSLSPSSLTFSSASPPHYIVEPFQLREAVVSTTIVSTTSIPHSSIVSVLRVISVSAKSEISRS